MGPLATATPRRSNPRSDRLAATRRRAMPDVPVRVRHDLRIHPPRAAVPDAADHHPGRVSVDGAARAVRHTALPVQRPVPDRLGRSATCPSHVGEHRPAVTAERHQGRMPGQHAAHAVRRHQGWPGRARQRRRRHGDHHQPEQRAHNAAQSHEATLVTGPEGIKAGHAPETRLGPADQSRLGRRRPAGAANVAEFTHRMRPYAPPLRHSNRCR